MPRSEASRAKDRARVKKWRKKNRARANANNRKAGATWRKKNGDRRAEQRFRFNGSAKQKALQLASGHQLSTLTRQSLQRPELRYIDPSGVLHREEELRAEELIQAWEKEQTR